MSIFSVIRPPLSKRQKRSPPPDEDDAKAKDAELAEKNRRLGEMEKENRRLQAMEEEYLKLKERHKSLKENMTKAKSALLE